MDGKIYDSDIYTSDEDEQQFVHPQHSIDIGGVKIKMPVKPYPCQQMVIKAVIDGCNTERNCLIESPTGSGKTLALLCGALGWVEAYKHKREIELLNKTVEREKWERAKKASNNPLPTKMEEGRLNDSDLEAFDAEDWDDETFAADDWDDWDDSSNLASMMPPPKVFYCSRTHKQLEQVVSELRKTTYGRTMRMTLLGSRDFTCIQETEMSKTKLCLELLDPSKKKGCCFHTEDNKREIGSFAGLENCGVKGPWDIEDLVTAGKSVGACPYFATRNLMPEADLILCPYNYIIDEGIRESTNINVYGNIIILDEAHNIEDACREAASVSISINGLVGIIDNCQSRESDAKSEKAKDALSYAKRIRAYCEKLWSFILSTELKREVSDVYSVGRWTGPEFIAVLKQTVGISDQATISFINAVREAIAAKASEKDALRMNIDPKPALDGESLSLLEKMVRILNMLTSQLHADDYRMFIKQLPSNSGSETFDHNELSLECLCMNPGVIFAPLCNVARSVILASGTLAPMGSYEGELGVKFPFVVQAPHVTPKEQIFIKCIDKYSNGEPLTAIHQNVCTEKFQDEIGNIILTACGSVPHGILVFVSSYPVMNRLCTRWQTTGMWNKLGRIKEIFQECRASGRDMTELMESYREAIRSTSTKPAGTVTGALLFAVYRGKVAEGIDFSDNEARCVITIGIPYAVPHNPATDLKIRYNDKNRRKGLPPGMDWYRGNAYKAMNQAFGRGIRHQNDWAAIIMIDGRIKEPRNTVLLPNWVKSMWYTDNNSNTDLRTLLNRFVARQVRRVKLANAVKTKL